MGKVKYNSALKGIRGKVDRWVFRRICGADVVSPVPIKNHRERKGEELANINRFAEAARSAKFASPEMVARYNARALQEPNMSAYSIRTRDYRTPPKIKLVYLLGYAGRPGDEILVHAWDDFEVKDVRIFIRRGGASLIESGFLERVADDLFRYVIKVAVPPGTDAWFEILARDNPGNETRWGSKMTVPEE
jgi:hypothetical protein